jgi:RNA polymerase sigma-70 factor (ECF subfamily)
MAEDYKHRLTPSGLGLASSPLGSSNDARAGEPVDQADAPGELDAWTDFHAAADILPEEIREVFHLIWYDGLEQADVAAVVGVSERTVRSRWQRARLAIHHALGGRLPGI